MAFACSPSRRCHRDHSTASSAPDWRRMGAAGGPARAAVVVCPEMQMVGQEMDWVG